MKLIPVIDLQQGRVVRARRGERHRYRPLTSTLCPRGDPEQLARLFVETFGVDTLYIADLDAITGNGDNLALIVRIARRLRDLTVWVDGGLGSIDVLRRFLDHGVGRPVIGTENLLHPQLLLEPEARAAVLSLDFRGPVLLGPAALSEDTSLWPKDVILMSLSRVGADGGPDMERLYRYRARAPNLRLYCAGGLRHADDLRLLTDAGAAGVLAASALHAGAIRADHLPGHANRHA